MQALAMNTTVPNACIIAGNLHTAQELLTEEVDADGYANRSVVRARNFEWDHALQDAIKVRHIPYYGPVRFTLLGDSIVHCNPTLVNGLRC